MTARERLTNSQIVLLRSLIRRGASIRAVTIAQWQRVIALPLWRRGLVDMWWRSVPDDSMQGPLPPAFRAAASVVKSDDEKAKWTELATRCEAAPEQMTASEARQFCKEVKQSAYADAYAAYAAAYADAAAAAYAAYAAGSKARDSILARFCEEVVQILIAMKAPGCAWLDLAPLEAVA